MQDRVPVNPGRVLITPENGSAAYYATMTRADNPTQEGTPLNKASLLKDTTAALLGLGVNAVPDDALAAIKLLIDAANANANTKAQITAGSYVGTGTYGSGNPNSLTFGFVPKFLAIAEDGQISPSDRSSFYWISPSTGGVSITSNDYSYAPRVSVNGNTISWYAKDVLHQLNRSATYHYVAIG